ncbi:MAG: hypothetical protein JWO48_690, partial [Bryobacterales bacterium]|nr:hypothetical protein [Bryobacterales bacterium]
MFTMRILNIITILSAVALSAQAQPEKPFLVFSTYFGGDRQDVATAVTTDAAGATYIAGETQSRNFPGKPLPGSTPIAVNNGFVAKFGPDGKQALWSFQIGGASATRANAMALDPAGNLWVTGRTGSRDFPLLNPVQDKMTGLNINFLMKLSPDGKLLFSTLFGGERNDEANAIAIDPAGSVYIGGRTSSTTFPLKNPLHSTPAGGDA